MEKEVYESMMLDLADAAIKIYHKDQVDLSGVDYRVHLNIVASKVAHLGKIFEIVGKLHDILEDTDMDEETLREDFSTEVVDAVAAITRLKSESYKPTFPR